MNNQDVFLSGKVKEDILFIREADLNNGENAVKALKRMIRKAKRIGAKTAIMLVDTFDPGAGSVDAFIESQNGKRTIIDKRYSEYEWTI